MTHAASDDETGSHPGFAAILRDRTKLVHRKAERVGFIADLLRGHATRRSYAMFLRNLVPVYAAMETALADSWTDSILGAFADPRLRRLPALKRDLATLEPDWARSLPQLEASATYVSAVVAVAGDPRLVAHAYARYLGDLSGGQILKPLLGRTLGLGPDTLAFYDFPDIADLTVPKVAMREALDRVPEADGEAIVAEAIAAFDHNIALSEAVQAVAA